MAEWKYRIKHIERKPETDLDAQIEEILQEQGEQGWELVQVLQETPNTPDCRLIFKAQQPVAMN